LLRARSIIRSVAAPVACAILAAILAAAAIPVRAASTVDDVSQGLTCQCGCGLTVANCNHPNCAFSVPLRTEIAGMLAKGKTRPQIIAFYRAKFGEKVLSAPTTEGFNLLAWVMPFAALLLGCGFVVLMIGRWRRQSPSLPSGPEAVSERVPVVDAGLKERLEEEVRGRL
jgi:cytochrome c-type biogenesis protein CcmH